MEVMQSMSDKPLRTCPVCMGVLQKQLYPVGIVYKGSGYYTTDYRKSDPSNSGDSDGKSESSRSKSESKSGDNSGSDSGGGSTGDAGSKEKSASSD